MIYDFRNGSNDFSAMFYCSEFEELEAVPTMAVMDGPLEPTSSTVSSTADAADDPAFVNFFSVCAFSENTMFFNALRF